MNSNALLIIAAVGIAGFASQVTSRLDAPPPAKPAAAAKVATAPRAAPTRPSTQPVSHSGRKVVVQRDRRGHYAVEATINGRRMDVMVDTGASVVAVNERSASRMGINPALSAFTSEVRTANGTVRAARVTFDAIEIGGIRVRDVTGLVVPDKALDENLLGLSFLSRLRRYEFADSRLVMEQ
ncbi:MAG: TIGR02281 family clan AA aspartic protease [Variibacter sp.]